MPELGFALSSEDHPPNELVRQAAAAERAGFRGFPRSLSMSTSQAATREWPNLAL
jgi:hypothetical protein